MEIKISEFFYHLLDYGGFSHKDGLILMWGDPDVMLLPESYLELKEGLEQELGDDAKGLFYWLGYVYGKNASDVLVSKFGFSRKDFDKFTNGGTQDGFGYLKIVKYPVDSQPVDVTLTATNCVVAELAKSRGLAKKVDDYLCGMIAGGSEPIFCKPISGEETVCIGEGAAHCEYRVQESGSRAAPGLLSKSGFDQDGINQRIVRRYMNRKFSTKFLEKKEVSFGDGGFSLKKTRGVLLPITDIVLLDRLCRGYAAYFKVLGDACRHMAGICSQPKILSRDALNFELAKAEVFGLGKFRVFSISGDSFLVENENSALPVEYREIFGLCQKPSCSISCALLSAIFSKMLSKQMKAVESECISQGKRKCLFKVEPC